MKTLTKLYEEAISAEHLTSKILVDNVKETEKLEESTEEEE